MQNKSSYHLIDQRPFLDLTSENHGGNHLPESSTISQFKPPIFISQERSRRPSPTTSNASRRQQQFDLWFAFNWGTKCSVGLTAKTKSPCPWCRRASIFPSGPIASTCRQTVTDNELVLIYEHKAFQLRGGWSLCTFQLQIQNTHRVLQSWC